ncbi:hypothetical protein BDAP_002480 [Binucleata daphniae]
MDHLYLNQDTKQRLQAFWDNIYKQAENDKLSTKGFNLPLARIKRLMKIEEQVKMVACEVPILFTKVTEKFIEELTLRAWLSTEDGKRRILQRSDINTAIKTSDMFDFLIYVVPKNENFSMEEYTQQDDMNNKKESDIM